MKGMKVLNSYKYNAKIGDIEFNYNKYLLAEEIQNIVVQCLDESAQIQREIMKDVLVLKYCTDIDFGDLSDLEIYNMYMFNDVLDFIKYGNTELNYSGVQNYNLIDKCIKQHESIDASLARFLDSATETIQKMEKKFPKNFDIKKFLSEFAETMNQVKK